MKIRKRLEIIKENYSRRLRIAKLGYLCFRSTQILLIIFIPSTLLYYLKIEYELSATYLIIIVSTLLFGVVILEYLYRESGLRNKAKFYEYSKENIENELFAYDNKIGIYKGKNRNEMLWDGLIRKLMDFRKDEIFLKAPEQSEQEIESTKPEFKLEKILEQNGINKLALQSEVENLITSLPMVKIGKWLLLGIVLVVIAIFTGGTIYSDMKIRGISEIADSATSTINNIRWDSVEIAEKFQNRISQANTALNSELIKAKELSQTISDDIDKMETKLISATNDIDLKITDLERMIESKFENIGSDVENYKTVTTKNIDGQFSAVKSHAEAKIPDINGQFNAVKSHAETKISDIDGQFNNVKGYANNAIDKINAEKSEALRIIDISSLGEFNKFKEQIESLKKAGGKVDLFTIRKFLDNSILGILIVLCGLLIFSTILNLILFIKRK